MFTIRCDADPAALAKYVYALVKKDKTLDELREGMVEQLDVFLQHGELKFRKFLVWDVLIISI